MHKPTGTPNQIVNNAVKDAEKPPAPSCVNWSAIFLTEIKAQKIELPIVDFVEGVMYFTWISLGADGKPSTGVTMGLSNDHYYGNLIAYYKDFKTGVGSKKVEFSAIPQSAINYLKTVNIAK